MQRSRTSFPVVLLLIAVLVGAISSYFFIRKFTEVPSLKTSCIDSLGHEISYVPGSNVSKQYADCIVKNAKIFVDKDFELTRDLSKAFLTLLVALLVGSITFSEKIINLAAAHQTSRNLMIICWSCLLSAIICCGAGLALMTLAAGWASYQPYSDFRVFERPAFFLFIASGLLFGSGLVSLLTAGIISMNESNLQEESVENPPVVSEMPAPTSAS